SLNVVNNTNIALYISRIQADRCPVSTLEMANCAVYVAPRGEGSDVNSFHVLKNDMNYLKSINDRDLLRPFNCKTKIEM
ncbi:hypothetical protein L9F63_011279, partial [Diploptera punctata]